MAFYYGAPCLAMALLAPSFFAGAVAVGSSSHKLMRKEGLEPDHETTRLEEMTAMAFIEGATVRTQPTAQARNITSLPLDLHGCENCCNDGYKNIPCLDVAACAAVAPTHGKYAFVLTQAGYIGNPHTFIPNVAAMREYATSDPANKIDIILMMTKATQNQMTDEHKKKIEDNEVKIMNVDWAVPPDMLWTRKENWCGLQDFIRLHVLGIEGYDAVAYYDSDIQLQGDARSIFRCASTGTFLSTSGGTGEPFNVGFFATRPDPRILEAAREFARIAPFDEKTGWGKSGYGSSNGYYVGAECGQGFFHTLYYQRNSEPGKLAMEKAGLAAPGAFMAAQIDRCIWNYQTSFQCKQHFDCGRVMAHHKPAQIIHGSNPEECMKKVRA